MCARLSQDLQRQRQWNPPVFQPMNSDGEQPLVTQNLTIQRLTASHKSTRVTVSTSQRKN